MDELSSASVHMPPTVTEDVSGSVSPRSMWPLFGLLAVACLASSVFSMRDAAAPALTVQSDRPSLVFQTYMLHEGLDPIPSQPLLTPFFDFTNKGAEPVMIQDVKPSCGCLSWEITAKEIPPGGTGRLTLPIRTRNEAPGLREYMVTVKYTDPDPREVTLTYKVVLPEKHIEIEPRVVMVMGKISSTDKDIVSISDHRPERLTAPIKIRTVASSSSIFNAQLAGHTSVDGVSRTAIEVTYSDAIPPGQHRGLITISTDDETYPTLQVPVILRDRNRPENEPVVVTPSVGRVIVDSAHPEKSKGTTITVTIPGHWKVSHLETFPSQLQGAIRKNEPGAGNTINVTVDLSLTELPATGVEQANLTLHATDGDEQEMVTVPITLLWR